MNEEDEVRKTEKNTRKFSLTYVLVLLSVCFTIFHDVFFFPRALLRRVIGSLRTFASPTETALRCRGWKAESGLESRLAELKGTAGTSVGPIQPRTWHREASRYAVLFMRILELVGCSVCTAA